MSALSARASRLSTYKSDIKSRDCRPIQFFAHNFALTDDIRLTLPFSLVEKRELRAARGSGITATKLCREAFLPCTPRAPSHDFKSWGFASNAEGLATSDKFLPYVMRG